MSKIIKCMFFVLLAAVLPLSVHAQQVTLHLQDVTVRKAFRELEVKGNVSLVYEKNDVDLTRKVTVKVDNQPISKALDQILKGQELIYKIKDNPKKDLFFRGVKPVTLALISFAGIIIAKPTFFVSDYSQGIKATFIFLIVFLGTKYISKINPIIILLLTSLLGIFIF